MAVPKIGRIIISAFILSMFVFGCGNDDLPSPHNAVILEKYTETVNILVGKIWVPNTYYNIRYEYELDGETKTKEIDISYKVYENLQSGDEIVLVRNEGCSGGWRIGKQ